MAEEWFVLEQSKEVQEAQTTDGVLHIAVIPYETWRFYNEQGELEAEENYD